MKILHEREMYIFSLCITLVSFLCARVISQIISKSGKLYHLHWVCKGKPLVHFTLFHILSHTTFNGLCQFHKNNVCTQMNLSVKQEQSDRQTAHLWLPRCGVGRGELGVWE